MSGALNLLVSAGVNAQESLGICGHGAGVVFSETVQMFRSCCFHSADWKLMLEGLTLAILYLT